MRPEIADAKPAFVQAEVIGQPAVFVGPKRDRRAVDDEAAQVTLAPTEHARQGGVAVGAGVDHGGECRAGISVALVDSRRRVFW